MKDITISPDITIRQAMKTLDKTAEKCLLVVDIENYLLGTLTDGDIRRAILNGESFSSTINAHYNKKPITIIEGSKKNHEIKQLLLKNKINLLPIVNSNHIVIGYRTWEDVFGYGNHRKSKKIKVPVVIMAGGKGTRLEPFTKVLPKPLVPIHGKPIIEHIIERFTDFGISKFILTVNYKGRILKAYFEELQPAYKVSFIDELEPLGTAGSLSYLSGKMDSPFFVTNCDIIVDADYNDIAEFHAKHGYDITLVASAKEYIIPYGTCELNGEGHLSHINEKPKYDFLINTGLYILNPDVLELIPENKFYHITHLIEDAKNQGKKVGIYPIDDDAWIDVGQWAEYRAAIKRMEL